VKEYLDFISTKKIEEDAIKGEFNSLINEIRFNVNILSEVTGSRSDFSLNEKNISSICSLFSTNTFTKYIDSNINFNKFDEFFPNYSSNKSKSNEKLSNDISFFYQRILILKTISENQNAFGKNINYKQRITNLKNKGLKILNAYNKKGK